MASGSGVSGVSGTAVAATAAGALLIWSGVKGASVSGALRSLLSGKAPSGTQTASLTAASTAGGGSGAGAVGGSISGGAAAAAYKAYAVGLLALHGWPGQYAAFNSVVMAESGWDSHALNASGAWGIAQALGHGTAATDAGNGHNEYGNYGTSDAVCKAANGGNGEAQIQWMLNYIGQAYGSPNAAWAFHQANNYY